MPPQPTDGSKHANQNTKGTRSFQRVHSPNNFAAKDWRLNNPAQNKFHGYVRETFDYPEHLKIPVPVDTLREKSDPYAGSKIGCAGFLRSRPRMRAPPMLPAPTTRMRSIMGSPSGIGIRGRRPRRGR